MWRPRGLEEPIRQRIFVVGVPRSGTTLVQSLLATHDDVASWVESHLFRRLFRPVPGLPSRAVLVGDPDAEVRAFLQACSSRDGPGDNDDGLWQRDALLTGWRHLPIARQLHGDVVARRLLDVFDDLARRQGRNAWVEKTPAHLRYLPFIERVASGAPDLRFVHVIRDGLETVASLHKASRHWQRPYGVDECVRRWNREVALSLARVDSPRDHFVVYEDLTADPERETRRLFDALGLSWQPRALDRYGESLQRVVSPEESAWKDGGERSISPSATSHEVLTDEQRRRAAKALQRNLYQDLCDQLRRRAVS